MELLPHPVPDRTKYDLLVKDTNTEQFATDCFVFFCKKINAAKGFSTSFRIYFKTLRLFPFGQEKGRNLFCPKTPEISSYQL